MANIDSRGRFESTTVLLCIRLFGFVETVTCMPEEFLPLTTGHAVPFASAKDLAVWLLIYPAGYYRAQLDASICRVFLIKRGSPMPA
jgi:hypothetical protein